jgi:hypothetical protein
MLGQSLGADVVVSSIGTNRQPDRHCKHKLKDGVLAPESSNWQKLEKENQAETRHTRKVITWARNLTKSRVRSSVHGHVGAGDLSS